MRTSGVIETQGRYVWKITEEAIVKAKYGSMATKDLAIEIGCTIDQLNNKARKLKLCKGDYYRSKIVTPKAMRMLELIRLLLRHEPNNTLIESLGISMRAIYRYIAVFRFMGIEVKLNNGSYYIESTNCPICGKQKPHE